MNIVMLSPGFPFEQAYFTRALAQTGARVIGVGDQPAAMLPPEAQQHLAHYEHVSLRDEEAVLAALRGLSRHVSIDRVECLWEPYVELAARIREHLELPGMTLEQATWFRDKEAMKQVLDAAGIRTPRHASARAGAEVWEAAERIGFPLIVKPIAGAGSADTYRVDSPEQLAEVQAMIRHVPLLSVEEFIDGQEFTYDTVCGDGDVLFENVSWYLPRPLEQRSHEWISPVTLSLRDTSEPRLAGGLAMGRAVLKALNFTDGFTHMEWYLKADGEAVFGEIGARPPGARTVDVMNYATDNDLFRTWAQAITTGTAPAVTHKFNAASMFKRAQGTGRISRVEGLDRLMRELGEHVCVLDLLPVGAPRRDWRATLLSDGMIIYRHPDLEEVLRIGDRFARELQLYAE
ncbi:ATP-grasp domain-containing protein [Ornithinimicrobium ciconiae]|uniref:ATP-grasp domain-containing protein n=1 Tax=Ornithinimicrobium ciconiae TaxID=2594265 RepID=A0A516GF52_9MICO|nr:ATP-grasp domain-containing protein [Ornithinimicrobium ciconiae]QDO90146.1 ATP-grasp domain-containing protein [Ornithinimicrobium ciconiae]